MYTEGYGKACRHIFATFLDRRSKNDYESGTSQESITCTDKFHS